MKAYYSFEPKGIDGFDYVAVMVGDDHKGYISATDCAVQLFPDSLVEMRKALAKYCPSMTLGTNLKAANDPELRNLQFINITDFRKLVVHSPQPQAKAYGEWVLNEALLCAFMRDPVTGPRILHNLKMIADALHAEDIADSQLQSVVAAQ